MNLKSVVAATAVLCAGLASVTSAQAVTWSFSYTGAGITASGLFTTAGAALTPEPILSVSGTRNGSAITGLVPVGLDPDFIYDNNFTVAAPNFTSGGFLFGVVGGASNVNVYFDAGQYFEVIVVNGAGVDTPINWSVRAVPEPATALSLLAGLGLLGVALRKRQSA